jgi:hypothetical protein
MDRRDDRDGISRARRVACSVWVWQIVVGGQCSYLWAVCGKMCVWPWSEVSQRQIQHDQNQHNNHTNLSIRKSTKQPHNYRRCAVASLFAFGKRKEGSGTGKGCRAIFDSRDRRWTAAMIILGR